MTRKQLLYSICPTERKNKCEDYQCSDCTILLIKWLDEYDKNIIEKYNIDTNLKDTIKEIHDNVANQMYCKGIDDFVIFMKETLEHDWNTTKISEQIIYNRLFDECDRIAEELKEGVKYEI